MVRIAHLGSASSHASTLHSQRHSWMKRLRLRFAASRLGFWRSHPPARLCFLGGLRPPPPVASPAANLTGGTLSGLRLLRLRRILKLCWLGARNCILVGQYLDETA